jgi:beta-lactamase class A
MKAWIVSLLVLMVTSAMPVRAQTQLDYLTAEINRLTQGLSGRVGVGIIHLETGRTIQFNGADLYPMASVVKMPIVLKLMHDVDGGTLALDRIVELGPEDSQPGSGKLKRGITRSGKLVTVAELIEGMMTESDNTATDRLLMLAGGPSQVTDYVRSLDIHSVRVDRSIRELLANHAGITDVPPIGTVFSGGVYRDRVRQVPLDAREEAMRSYADDPRDTATPLDMSRLFGRLMLGNLLTPASTTYLLGVLERARTGPHRLKGLLPPNTIIGHKTGTVGTSTNDCGIITLPDGAGHLAVSVFVKGSAAPGREREQVIAHIARAAYDYFLFNR